MKKKDYGTRGGPMGGKHHSEETKKKASERSLKMWSDPGHRNLMREKHSGENNPNYGKKRSEEQAEKLRVATLWRYPKVTALNIETGEEFNADNYSALSRLIGVSDQGIKIRCDKENVKYGHLLCEKWLIYLDDDYLMKKVNNLYFEMFKLILLVCDYQNNIPKILKPLIDTGSRIDKLHRKCLGPCGTVIEYSDIYKADRAEKLKSLCHTCSLRTESFKIKQSAALKGKPSGRIGFKHSPETIELLKLRRKDRVFTQKTKDKIGNAHRGKVMSPEARFKMSIAKGGTGITATMRNLPYTEGQLKAWAKKVKAKISHCEKCFTTDNLEAHHIMPKIKFVSLALDISNGMTLCSSCHDEFHAKGGECHKIIFGKDDTSE